MQVRLSDTFQVRWQLGISKAPQWWAGPNRGWVEEKNLGPTGPVFVIDNAGAESSLHWDQRTLSFIHIATYGFGAATIGFHHDVARAALIPGRRVGIISYKNPWWTDDRAIGVFYN